MKVDQDVPVPEDANALLVAQSLVAERFIQLTPAYTGGEELPDGGTIPVERTAVPVEWDGVKEQLMKLSTALSPAPGEETGPMGDFVDSADAMFEGNGHEIRDALAEVSHTMSIMSDGRENLFTTLKNLHCSSPRCRRARSRSSPSAANSRASPMLGADRRHRRST